MWRNLLIAVTIVTILLIIVAIIEWRAPCFFTDQFRSSGTSSPKAEKLGEFDFELIRVLDNSLANGVDVELSFTINSGESADSDRLSGFIQIVRTQDLCGSKRFYFPSEEKRARATESGWYVDRRDGAKVPFFGHDGSETITPSSFYEAKAKIEAGWTSIMDAPYRPENRDNVGIRWEAVSVPVPIHDPEYNRHLGFYYWSWTVDDAGVVTAHSGLASSELIRDVEDAIIAWKAQKRNPQMTSK